jgi:ATP-dependent Clp protease ATP-binding subunit ClpB
METTGIKENTKKRLEEVEKELSELKERSTSLKIRWNEEKRLIQSIREYKEEIESLKTKADQLERQGDLAGVAEIRYGSIHNIEKKLENATLKLKEIQAKGIMLKEEITDEDIAEIIAKSTGIPVKRMLESERSKLINMEERIHQRVISQDEAVSSVSNAIRRSRAGLQDEYKPLGSFIFIGTTGVGKTEMARALAEFLFDDEQAIIRIDMSEYMEKHSVSRLIGAPPGYVGYEEGGQLTEQVRRKPYAVVLLDEIEKAHKDVFNILLQVLDDGRLTDGKGRTVNFKNTIVIMTSNLGTEIIQDRMNEINEENRDEIMNKIKYSIIDLLKKNMRPEFINRVDDIVLFNPLTQNDIAKIAENHIKMLKNKLAKRDLNLKLSDAALEWITKIGFDLNYGARPLKRAIQKYIANPLAVKLLENKYIAGDTINIDTDANGNFIFN